MKYLLPLAFGLSLPVILTLIFFFMPSYGLLSALFTSIDGFNGNSAQWWWLSVHDSAIVFITTALLLWLYYQLYPRVPFNLKAMLVVQAPLAVVTLTSLVQSSYFLGNTYQNAMTLNRLLCLFVVLLVYAAFKRLPAIAHPR